MFTRTRRSNGHLTLLMLWTAFLLCLSTPRAHAQSLLAGNPANNPNGPFTYGTLSGTGITKFNVVSFPDYGGGPLTSWNFGETDPNVVYNPNPTHISHGGTILWPANSIKLHPAPDGTPAVVRFTAPSPGQYRAVGYFDNRDLFTTTDVHVRANGGSPLFNGTITGGGSFGKTSPFDVTVNLAAGDSMDFYVGFGSNGNYFSDSTGLVLTIEGNHGPPTTTATLSGTQGLDDWYTSNVEVTLAATDPDGSDDVAATYYSLDGSGAGPYTGPFSVSGDGSHTVKFWSVDNSANQEEERTITFRIDSTPPSTQAVLPEPNTNGWYSASVAVSLSAGDSTSGVAATYYQLDGGAPQQYLAPFLIVAEGVHSLLCWSKDAAGNSEFPLGTRIAIDKTAPTVEVSVSPSVLQSRGSAEVTFSDSVVKVSGKVSDSVSEVEPGSLSFEVVDEYGTFQPSGPVTIDELGNFSFEIDFSGNTGIRGQDKNHERSYSIRIRTRDLAGNAGSGSAFLTARPGASGEGGSGGGVRG